MNQLIIDTVMVYPLLQRSLSPFPILYTFLTHLHSLQGHYTDVDFYVCQLISIKTHLSPLFIIKLV